MNYVLPVIGAYLIISGIVVGTKQPQSCSKSMDYCMPALDCSRSGSALS